MIHQALRHSIEALIPNVTVFSESKTAFLERSIASQIQLTNMLGVDWAHYQQPVKLKPSVPIIPALEELLQKSLTTTNNYVYAFLIFKSSTTAIKTDILSLINNYDSVPHLMTKILVWNPTEGYALENSWPNDKILGLVNKGNDPIPNFIPEKNSNAYTFMLNKGSFHEFIKSFGLEVLGDDEANTILANFQSMVQFTPWGHIDWNKFEKKFFVGNTETNVLPTLQKLLNKPFDTKVYCDQKQLEAPLLQINLTSEMIRRACYWSRGYGAFLFNLESGYVIEVDLLGNITVGVLN